MTRALRRCLRDPLTSLLAVVIVALGTGATTVAAFAGVVLLISLIPARQAAATHPALLVRG